VDKGHNLRGEKKGSGKGPQERGQSYQGGHRQMYSTCERGHAKAKQMKEQ